jgi:hypothetical protein
MTPRPTDIPDTPDDYGYGSYLFHRRLVMAAADTLPRSTTPFPESRPHVMLADLQRPKMTDNDPS